MFKFILPIILIGLSITIFFTFTNPFYQDISLLRLESSAYNTALGNSKTLESERDKLTQKYNSIGGENLARLQKFLPESVDNIRLILEVERLAMPYGMALRDVKYEANLQENPRTPGIITGGPVAEAVRKDYGIWNLEFSTEGSYDDLVNFVKDLENNLRIVDIAGVSFASGSGLSTTNYKFSFKVKTYWLRN